MDAEFTVTPAAAAALEKEIAEGGDEGDFHRLEVGLVGNNVAWDVYLTLTEDSDDVVVRQHGAKVVVDRESAENLKGMVLDYEAGGFRLFIPGQENPEIPF